MSLPLHLLDQARLLATRRGNARSADLKRATSALYYAVFHLLAERCANALVGKRRRHSDAWQRAYRALDHGKAKQEFRRLLSGGEDRAQIGVKALLELALLFVELQELRHEADYDPRPGPLTRSGIVAVIKRIEAALPQLDKIDDAIWLDLATALLFKDRK